MRTPLGPVDALDLRDHEVCAELLALEKHQLIEGIVFESVFDQYLGAVEAASDGTLRQVHVETVMVGLPSDRRDPQAYGAFVWAKSKTGGLGRFLQALEARYRVWLVEWCGDTRDFTATLITGGRRAGAVEPLADVCARVSKNNAPTYESVEPSVSDLERIEQSVRYLSSHYGDRLGADVVLSRVFINWSVYPWFREGVWNLDRIFLHGNRLWHMEIKHKYPMEREARLHFGINDGELRQIASLLECGLRSLHVVTVKPFWERQSGSMYLLNDLEARSRAAILSMELTSDKISRAFRGLVGTSAAHTSFLGRSSVSFRSFEATGFRSVGVLADTPTSIGSAIVSQMGDGPVPPPCTDDGIRALRMAARTGTG